MSGYIALHPGMISTDIRCHFVKGWLEMRIYRISKYVALSGRGLLVKLLVNLLDSLELRTGSLVRL